MDSITGLPCVRCTETEPCCDEHGKAPEYEGGHRKSICTNVAKAKFLEAISKGSSQRMAAFGAGWSYEVFIKWKQEVKIGDAPAHLIKFIEDDIPAAKAKLYMKALDAVVDGLDQEDDDKRAQLGMKVLEKLFGSELDTAPVTVQGAGGGPVEFRIVMDAPALPPKLAERVLPEDVKE